MKVMVCFAEGFEEVEAIGVVDVLRRAEIDVIMAGVNQRAVISSHKISINMDALIEEINIDDIDMIILPGGQPGVDNLEKNDHIKEILFAFWKQSKYIGAICAAPSLLGKLGLLKGKQATCYPGFEKFLEGAYISDKKVVIDGKIITAQGAGVSLEFGYKIVEVLKGKELADKLKKAMIA